MTKTKPFIKHNPTRQDICSKKNAKFQVLQNVQIFENTVTNIQKITLNHLREISENIQIDNDIHRIHKAWSEHGVEALWTGQNSMPKPQSISNYAPYFPGVGGWGVTLTGAWLYNKNNLRTTEAQIVQKLKNNEPRRKFTVFSYEKKKRVAWNTGGI